MDDRSGLVADIANTLGCKGINIETLDAESECDHGIVVLTVDRYDEAVRALREASFTTITEDAILIKIKDEPGALAIVAMRFKEANINLKSLRIVKREAGYSLAAICVEETSEASELLKGMADTVYLSLPPFNINTNCSNRLQKNLDRPSSLIYKAIK